MFDTMKCGRKEFVNRHPFVGVLNPCFADKKHKRLLGHVGFYDIDTHYFDAKISELAELVEAPVHVLHTFKGFHLVTFKILKDPLYRIWWQWCRENLPKTDYVHGDRDTSLLKGQWYCCLRTTPKNMNKITYLQTQGFNYKPKLSSYHISAYRHIIPLKVSPRKQWQRTFGVSIIRWGKT